MAETTKEALARAEFWSMEAMNQYPHGSGQREILAQAHDLIKRAVANEEDAEWHRVMMAVQK